MSKLLLNILLFLALASCATNPLGRSQLSLLPSDQLSDMGSQAFNQMKRKRRLKPMPMPILMLIVL
ncbi:MAG: hypothetical protein R3E08_08475 [Thiotrichaceae bacterium]